MKYLIALSLLFCSQAFASTEVYETTCKSHNCFKYGWVTTSSSGYEMDTVCKKHDCSKYGWHSEANDDSNYDVNCRKGGCFTDGWTSTQNVDGELLYDDVFCKGSS